MEAAIVELREGLRIPHAVCCSAAFDEGCGSVFAAYQPSSQCS